MKSIQFPSSQLKPLLPTNLNRSSLQFHLKTTIHNHITTCTYTDEDQDVKALTKFKSNYNHIEVLQVSRHANHPLAGSRLLLLDKPGNIHSMSITNNTYFDVFATLPPIVPRLQENMLLAVEEPSQQTEVSSIQKFKRTIAVLGFGAGFAAKLILELYNDTEIHGWELDPSVITVAREFFGLSQLEEMYGDSRLFINIGDALEDKIDGMKFSAILVDLFRDGSVVKELQEVSTWVKLKSRLVDGGRMMVNCGGSCVEAEDPNRDGKLVMEETVKAMAAVFGSDKVFVLSVGRANGGCFDSDSFLALTGPLPDLREWKQALPDESLRRYVDWWMPFNCC